MSSKQILQRYGWYRIGGLIALALFGLALTASGAFAHVPGDGAALATTANRPHAAFTPGDLVIYRVGDGSAALAGVGTAVFLDEYTPLGTLVQSIAVPTNTVGLNRRLVASGSATSEGLITRSTDGNYVLLTGYDAALGTASLTSSSAITVPRVIGRLDANGSLDTSTALIDASSGGSPRSAASSNGTDLWIAGAAQGVRYATMGAITSTQVSSSTVTNMRQMNIFGNQLYVSSASGAIRLATVGTGLPTTSGQAVTNLPGFPTSGGSPYGYYLADLDTVTPGLDTLYVADDTPPGTISKYSLVSGTWTLNPPTTTITIANVRSLAGVTTGTVVTLYAAASASGGAGGLYSYSDVAGYNAPITGTLTTLATAATNTAFRGVAFVPGVVVPTITPTNTPVPPTNTPTNTLTATPTNTPQTLVVGHVTWQGRPAQPDPLQQLPITLTLKMGASETNYPSQTTDSNGNFTVNVGGMPDGTYDWRVKGPKFLANSGTLSITAQTTTSAEMGLMKTGDCNNDNVVNIQDVGIMRNTFNKTSGDPGYDPRADLDGNNTVNITDYNLMRGNFGGGGAPPIRPGKR